MSKNFDTVIVRGGEVSSGDFSGEYSVFTDAERLEYLNCFEKFSQKQGFDNKTKLVTQNEIKDAIKKSGITSSGEGFFSTMRAYSRKKSREYSGWDLYTFGAGVEDGAVVMRDNNIPPVPCAKYAFSKNGRLKRLDMQVYIPKDFKAPLVIEPFITTTGRIIELRSQKDEIIKLQFYCNGTLCARLAHAEKYHHENVIIGSFDFGKFSDISIIIGEETFGVSLNGVEVKDLPLTGKAAPDTLFLSGGMQPVGEWRVKPLCAKFSSGEEISEFFIPPAEEKYIEQEIGEAEMPQALGCYENRDRMLILEKEFECSEKDGTPYLYTEAIDPCGKIYINGALARTCTDFMSCDFDISAFVSPGKNLLRIEVEPRAPQIHYSWHRCDDTYNAWYAAGVKVYNVKWIKNNHSQLITLSAGKVSTVKLTCELKNITDKSFSGSFEASMQNIKGGKIISLCGGGLEITANGEHILEREIQVAAGLWTPQTPELYKVTVTIYDKNKTVCQSDSFETGIRTVEQKDGAVFLNGKRTFLKGALVMQFLPPYEKICKNHVLPSTGEIVWQVLMAKKMNSNALRLHMLGFGTNESRFASICDRLGIMLIWTTRLIDTLESMLWSENWRQGASYAKQAKERINHPSIIMWEGSNEYYGGLSEHDRMHDAFITAVKSVDTSRLLSPCSHLYYSPPCNYYQEDGLSDAHFKPAKSSFSWHDKNLIRSAHNYVYLCGYGRPWSDMRAQPWDAQPAMLSSKDHSYMITEFAVIGRQNPDTPEAKEFINKNSYELLNEWHIFKDNCKDADWRLSQAHQALCAGAGVRVMKEKGIDGMFWCCLTGGANDGSYLKPPIDFYGYPKLAFYALKNSFEEVICFNLNPDVIWGKGYKFCPVLHSEGLSANFDITITFKDAEYSTAFVKEYKNIASLPGSVYLPPFYPQLKPGAYAVEYSVTKTPVK